MTLGSLFSGSGGFELAGLLCGIEPLWASEIEPFPIRVTTKRLPQVEHLGDINKIDGTFTLPVDIITAGFCCQDLSVAGKRAGLRGARSGLFFQATRIIREMRMSTRNKFPSFAVLENVPGMYTSNNGLDFLEVLNELAKIKDETLSVPLPKDGKWSTAGEIVGDGFSIGWRTFDAQFWGVPQRRRRCYIIVHFTGERAGEILFDENRLLGNPPQGGCPREGTAGGFAAGFGNPIAGFNGYKSITGSIQYTENLAAPLEANMPGNVLVFENHPADSRVKMDESGTVQTLTGRMGTGGGNVPLVMNERQYAMTVCEDVANTLTATDYKGTQCLFEPTKNAGGMAVVALEGNGARPSHKGNGYRENIAYSLNTVEQHAVAYGIDRAAFNQGVNAQYKPQIDMEKSATVVAKGPGAVAHPKGARYIVRRLTPQECALLQGFPANYCAGLETPEPTEADIEFWAAVWEAHRLAEGKSKKPKSRKQIIKWLKNPHSDSAEYKMWGNGIALPCCVFVLSGIALKGA